jgi:hypothetical protein
LKQRRFQLLSLSGGTDSGWMDVRAFSLAFDWSKIAVSETDEEKIEFPALSLGEAIEALTEAAYGKRLTLNMPEESRCQ